MFFKLLLLFSVIPLAELAILIEIGKKIGVLYTVILVIITGAAGAFLARHQGFLVMRKIRDDLEMGKIPADEMIQGLLILAGGLMLLTPGIITDIAGFTMILPFTRALYARFLKKRFSLHIHDGFHPGGSECRTAEDGGFVYEGSATEFTGDEEE